MSNETCPKCGAERRKADWACGSRQAVYDGSIGSFKGEFEQSGSCMVIADLRRRLAEAEKERDAWKKLMKATIDEAIKATGDCGLCLSNECGGCETDDSIPCDDIAKWAARAWYRVENNHHYDTKIKLRDTQAAVAELVDWIRVAMFAKAVDELTAHALIARHGGGK